LTKDITPEPQLEFRRLLVHQPRFIRPPEQFLFEGLGFPGESGRDRNQQHHETQSFWLAVSETLRRGYN